MPVGAGNADSALLRCCSLTLRSEAVAGRPQGVILLAYWSLRRLLELLVLRFRSEREKEIEILLLRHQLRVLERQVSRSALAPADRALWPEQSWAEFLRAQAGSILECDFLTVDSAFLKRFYVLFFIELATRRVRIAGITTNPDGHGVSQQARNLLVQLGDEGLRPRLLIRDRDSKFTRDFDEVFRSAGIRVIKAPVRAPKARAYAERGVGTVRRECRLMCGPTPCCATCDVS
jgi:transposase InsO family protein